MDILVFLITLVLDFYDSVLVPGYPFILVALAIVAWAIVPPAIFITLDMRFRRRREAARAARKSQGGVVS